MTTRLPRTIQQRREYNADERFAFSEIAAKRLGRGTPATAFGRELQRQRRRRRLSMKQLGRLAGLSTTAISRLESGERPTLPLRSTVLAIAEALAATPGDRDRLLVLSRHMPAGRGVRKLVYDRLGLELPE